MTEPNSPNSASPNDSFAQKVSGAASEDSEASRKFPKDDLFARELASFGPVGRAYIRRLKAREDGRSTYSKAVYDLCLWWLVALGFAIALHGMKTAPFRLSDSVLIALIVGGSANVLGLLYVVTGYFFSKEWEETPRNGPPVTKWPGGGSAH